MYAKINKYCAIPCCWIMKQKLLQYCAIPCCWIMKQKLSQYHNLITFTIGKFKCICNCISSYLNFSMHMEVNPCSFVGTSLGDKGWKGGPPYWGGELCPCDLDRWGHWQCGQTCSKAGYSGKFMHISFKLKLIFV